MDDAAVKLIVDTFTSRITSLEGAMDSRLGAIERRLDTSQGHDNIAAQTLQALSNEFAGLKPSVVLKADCDNCGKNFVTKREVKWTAGVVTAVLGAIYGVGQWLVSNLQNVHQWIEPFNPGGGSPPTIQ